MDKRLTILKGVGPKMAEKLMRRGLVTVEDVLFFLPLHYDDCREVTPLEQLGVCSMATTWGVVVQAKERRRRGRRIVEVGLASRATDAPRLWCVWFRAYPGQVGRYPAGTTIMATGPVRSYKDSLQMIHPHIATDEVDQKSVRARYPEIEGIAPRIVARLCRDAAQQMIPSARDGLPLELAQSRGLPTVHEALRLLHLLDEPHSVEELALLNTGQHPAQQRLVFEELFSLQLALAWERGSWEHGHALPCAQKVADQRALEQCFPYRLTASQRRAIAEIAADMSCAKPMHRLLQGDVGSGKTAVAFAAAHIAMCRGRQVAIMAPTALLAEQHYQVMTPWCAKLGFHTALLTADIPRNTRRECLASVADGRIQLLIGTHALLSPEVTIPQLGLVIIDEQHRFGVRQRAALRRRSDGAPFPHLLVMTATPIPRTLALCLYADLDLTLIDEKPAGRVVPQTLLFLQQEQQQQVLDLVAQQLRAGQQVFVVCPLIEESDKLQVADAVSTAELLRQQFRDYQVDLLHGRLSAAKKSEVMQAFRRREVQILVATTVIEVGIDVPDANVMVIWHAERFGLAQLHQLRGRIGRRDAISYCLLLAGVPPDSQAAQRLNVMVRSSDGFAIAEADLALRGPGEMLGTRQAGLPRLQYADLRRQTHLLVEAQRAAQQVLARDPDLSWPEHQAARQVMNARWKSLMLIGAESG